MERYGERFDTEKETANMVEKPLATFQVITDTHVRDDAGHIHNRHFEQALADLSSFCESSLGIMHAGDVTDRGLASEYLEFQRIWNEHSANLPDLYVTLGNHDIGAVLWEENGTPVDLSILSDIEIEDTLDGHGRISNGISGKSLNDLKDAVSTSSISDSTENSSAEIGSVSENSSISEIAEERLEAGAEKIDVSPLNAAEALAEAAAAVGLDLSGLAERLSGAGKAGSPARELWQRRMRRFAEGTGEAAPYHDHWLGGYHFIFLGSESPHPKDCDLSQAQLDWLKERLAEESSPDRPVFIFLHQPLIDTVAGSMQSQGWYGVNQDAELKLVLSTCPQAILFTGHTHWQLEAQRTMYDGQGIMPSMFNASSVGYLWTDGDEHLTGSEGLQIEIYRDRVIVRGRDFVRGAWIEGAEYTVEYPVSRSEGSELH